MEVQYSFYPAMYFLLSNFNMLQIDLFIILPDKIHEMRVTDIKLLDIGKTRLYNIGISKSMIYNH